MTAIWIGIAALALVIGMGAALWFRRARRRHDSVGAFSAATDAMKHLGDQPPVDVVTHSPDEYPTPSVRVLPDIAVLKLDRTRTTTGRSRTAERSRPDADVLARRPVIASLPSLLSDAAAHPSRHGRLAGDAAEQN